MDTAGCAWAGWTICIAFGSVMGFVTTRQKPDLRAFTLRCGPSILQIRRVEMEQPRRAESIGIQTAVGVGIPVEISKGSAVFIRRSGALGDR
jgi:hypothetical protein